MTPPSHRPARVARRIASRVQQSSSPSIARSIARVTRPIGGRRTAWARRLVHAVVTWGPRRAGAVPAPYDGVEFLVDLQDNLQRTLFYMGDYEGELHDLLVEELRAGDVFVDIGANVGVHALPIARRLAALGGRTIAFEPAVDTAAVLRENAARNGIAIDVELVALGKDRGTGSLHQSPAWEAGDLGVRSLHGEGEVVGDVEIVPFDDWAEARGLDRLDIVKIDVEGAEFDVLAGMQRTLRRLRPRLVIVEVIDYFLQRSGSSADALDALLRDLGYEIQGPTVAEIVQGPTDARWPNAVYRAV